MRSRPTNVVVFGAAAALGIAGVACLGSLWIALGDRGLRADATGTAGYTTATDVVLGTSGLILLLAATSLLVVGLVRLARTKRPQI